MYYIRFSVFIKGLKKKIVFLTGGEIPLHCLQSWLKSDGLGKKRNQTLGMIAHDIYVIGTQESSLSDREWSNRILSILEFFGEEFYIVGRISITFLENFASFRESPFYFVLFIWQCLRLHVL